MLNSKTTFLIVALLVGLLPIHKIIDLLAYFHYTLFKGNVKRLAALYFFV